MNQKKSVLLSGTLMYPLVVGGIAMIYHQGQFIRTSRIVAIRKRTARKICFETMNTNYIVDQIILLLDGRSFYEQAFHELADRCHLAAWNQYKKEACFEQKKHTIRFNGYFCTSSTWMHSTEWTLNNAMKDILRGAAHYETNSFHICPFDITELLGYGHKAESEYEFITCEKVKGLKMFKNGRVDLRFAADTNAREFIERYLGTAV